MTDGTKNTMLSQACARLRKERPLTPVGLDVSTSVERVDGLPFMNLWFRTQGCSHDHQGACTFCNYGVSSPVPAEIMIDYVRKGLSSLDIDENTILLVTPSGSMFDDREVPGEAREAIFQLISHTKCRSFLCESRAETITEAAISHYARIFVDKIASIELGLESSNPWVLRYCINKNLALGDYQQAIALLNKYLLGSSTTVMLGAAFLSPREAIADTVETVKWAFRQGTERVCIFPAHVKRWTMLEWLWKRNLYSPPSLWSLIEVLKRLGPELSPRIYTAWYKVYDRESEGRMLDPIEDLEYLCSPTTCVKCRHHVMKLLDLYRDQHSFRTIEELAEFECTCKRDWKATVDTLESTALAERVIHAYELIGAELLDPLWWGKNRERVLCDVAPV